jgi:hypothetical protein
MYIQSHCEWVAWLLFLRTWLEMINLCSYETSLYSGPLVPLHCNKKKISQFLLVLHCLLSSKSINFILVGLCLIPVFSVVLTYISTQYTCRIKRRWEWRGRSNKNVWLEPESKPWVLSSAGLGMWLMGRSSSLHVQALASMPRPWLPCLSSHTHTHTEREREREREKERERDHKTLLQPYLTQILGVCVEEY